MWAVAAPRQVPFGALFGGPAPPSMKWSASASPRGCWTSGAASPAWRRRGRSASWSTPRTSASCWRSCSPRPPCASSRSLGASLRPCRRRCLPPSSRWQTPRRVAGTTSTMACTALSTASSSTTRSRRSRRSCGMRRSCPRGSAARLCLARSLAPLATASTSSPSPWLCPVFAWVTGSSSPTWARTPQPQVPHSTGSPQPTAGSTSPGCCELVGFPRTPPPSFGQRPA
mmetsp:Transcript_108404/g.324178  ORF Transcript_108404/g.324178 Transcript_108404/m.324178 type:complete len:228 (-) Transcript_108404:67-750(-)